MPRKFKEDILEVGEDGAKIRNADVRLRQTVNYLGDEIVAAAANSELRVATDYFLDAGDRAKAVGGAWIIGGEHHGAFGTVSFHQVVRRVDVDDAAVLDDSDAVAQALGFFHEMSGQKNGFAAFADAADQIPDGAASLGVEAGG